jgi:Ca2+-transporting ATPase
MKPEYTETHIWSVDAEEVFEKFETSPEGLANNEVETRRGIYGRNSIQSKKVIKPYHILFRQFKSPLVLVLVVAALLTFALQEWIDGTFIMLAVLINVSLAFYQEYRAEHTIETLSSYIKERARVVRGGVEYEVDSVELVPGDVVRLAYGARVPADGRIISENNLTVDEALLTGESLPIEKVASVLASETILAERHNMVHAGTLVVEGYATVVVTHTGKDTELGKIAELVTHVKQGKTPLQKSLASLAWVIFFGVCIIVIGVFMLGIHRGEPMLEMLILSIAIAVGSVPEALPIVLTVILAVGAERIARAQGVVRSLSSAETLGSASVVMVDKTGTLTEANMQLIAVSTTAEMCAQYAVAEELSVLTTEKTSILEDAFASSDVIVENPADAEGEWRFIGRPVEVGIIRALQQDGKRSISDIFASRKPAVLAFNSTNKFAVSRSIDGANYVVVGAPDILLERANISKDEFIKVSAWIQKVSEEGKRLIGVARMSEYDVDEPKLDALIVRDLEFLGVLVFKDPIRVDTREAVSRIQSLGARVVMVTGDLKGTAMAVASELGWRVSEHEVLTGKEVRSLSDEELLPLLAEVKVCARMTPEDKLRVGTLFKQRGEVVAMTGDGVNDAPSLRAVDIGVALGSGSDVAKSAADLVLLNDSFATIVSAIEEGRRILVNIRKSFVYLMSNALDEVILIGGSLIFGLPLPLTALQIIWVNLFTGSLPALSLAFDSNNESTERVRGGDTGVFNTEVKTLTIGIGVATSILLFMLYFFLLSLDIALEEVRTLLFVCFAGYILVVSYSFRSLRRPLFSFSTFSNRYLNLSILVSLALIVLTVSVPWLREVFELAVPPVAYIWIVGVWFVINIALVECAKWGMRVYMRSR